MAWGERPRDRKDSRPKNGLRWWSEFGGERQTRVLPHRMSAERGGKKIPQIYGQTSHKFCGQGAKKSKLFVDASALPYMEAPEMNGQRRRTWRKGIGERRNSLIGVIVWRGLKMDTFPSLLPPRSNLLVFSLRHMTIWQLNSILEDAHFLPQHTLFLVFGNILPNT